MPELEEKDRRRIAAYEKELESNPRSLVFITLAEEYNRLADHVRAADVARKGLNYHPSSVGGRLALAVAESGQGRFREALEQIKEALIVDQDNPQALALMGSLLLQKGMAKRAIQFLGQAVKLEPESREYADLLKRAKRLAEDEQDLKLPDVRADAPSPWSEQDAAEGATEFAASASGEEATVFAAGGAKASLAKKLEALGPPQEEQDPQDHTTYDVRNLLFDGKRPTSAELPPLDRGRVGGSAAESRSASREEALVAGPPLEPPTEGFPKPVPTSDLAMPAGLPQVRPAPDAVPTRIERSDAKEKDAPSEKPSEAKKSENKRSIPPPPPPPADEAPTKPPEEANKKESDKKEGDKNLDREARIAAAKEKAAAAKAKKAADAAEAKDAKADPPKEEVKSAPKDEKNEDKPKDAKPEKPAKAEAKPKADPKRPSDDRPATQMVDDAIWALYGGDKPSAKKGPVVESEKSKDKEKDAGREGGGVRREVMVVRTSATMGIVTWWASVIVIAGLSGWAGYAAMSARQPSSVSDAEEELRSLGHDLEDGSLASLLAAEESLDALSKSFPTLEGVLSAARAEMLARRWKEFGGSTNDLEGAKSVLSKLDPAAMTLEGVSARVMTSSGAMGIENARRSLTAALTRYPNSPKALVAKARLFVAEGKDSDALEALHGARVQNANRRETLLELARWHARSGQVDAALAYYAKILETRPSDIQVLLEQYALAHTTARAKLASDAEGQLFALLKEERKQVAKDEAGRGALVFAVADLMRGDREAALDQLGRAEAAYESSASFKKTVGSVYLALGSWDRALAMFEGALELEPNDVEVLMGVERARYGKAAKIEPGAEGARSPEKISQPGHAEAPFGSVEFAPGTFELVAVSLHEGIFPKFDRKMLEAKDVASALEAATVASLARLERQAGRLDAAMTMIEKARKLFPHSQFDAELGRILLAQDKSEEAKSAFLAAVDKDAANVQARYGLALHWMSKQKPLEALEVLNPVEKAFEVAPKALRLLAKLRHERGDDRGAKDVLARLTEGPTSDPALLLELGAVEHAEKDFESALQRYTSALKGNKTFGVPPKKGQKDERSPVDLYYLGRLVLEEDQKRGIALLEASVASDEAPDEAHFYLGKALIKTAKTKKQGQKELELYRKAHPDGELSKEAQKLLRGR